MLIVAALFILVFCTVVLSVALGQVYFRSKQKRQIRSMLKNAEATSAEQYAQLLRPAEKEDKLGEFLRRFRFMERLDTILSQSGMSWTSTKLISTSGLMMFAGALAGMKLHFSPRWASSAVCAVLASLFPLLIVLRKRAKTLKAFEEQFPEALDFLSRSMRAGHGFTVAMEMLGADSPEPLGPAFRRISNDMQLGSSLEGALSKLVNRVPLLDVRFFVSSVILQQETGGNLGEILSKLAHIIRERFRLRGQVKAVSAHGRITGLVLVLMPVGVTLLMMVISPDYLQGLYADKVGREMVYGAIFGQVLGYLAIKKIVNIKV